MSGVPGVSDTPKDAEATARLKKYWTAGPGREKWIHDPHPWTTLRKHLLKFMPLDEATRTTTVWFHLATGRYPTQGEKLGPDHKFH